MRNGDCGRSLIGLLIALLILGGMAGAVMAYGLGGLGEGGAPHRSGAGAAGTLSPAPAAAGNDRAAAAEQACRADYAAVSQAAQYFETLYGHAPTAMADLAPLLKAPVSSARFAITVDPRGQVLVGATGRPAAPGPDNCTFAG